MRGEKENRGQKNGSERNRRYSPHVKELSNHEEPEVPRNSSDSPRRRLRTQRVCNENSARWVSLNHWVDNKGLRFASDLPPVCRLESASTRSSKFDAIKSGLGPRGSKGTPLRLIQQTLNPKFFAPITSKEFDETKRISVFFNRTRFGATS